MKHSVTVAALAKPSAVVLTALAAIVMTDYLKRTAAYPDPETLCQHCQSQNNPLARDCNSCGLPLSQNTEAQ